MLLYIGRKLPYENFDIFERTGVFFIRVACMYWADKLYMYGCNVLETTIAKQTIVSLHIIGKVYSCQFKIKLTGYMVLCSSKNTKL
ncbi:hypothetical protein BY458DRAFT_515194 [Sporodiniella umbellata]|nr:hypothetical protein BY458DRAFT_515194 [Sporodiniella umbellata]